MRPSSQFSITTAHDLSRASESRAPRQVARRGLIVFRNLDVEQLEDAPALFDEVCLADCIGSVALTELAKLLHQHGGFGLGAGRRTIRQLFSPQLLCFLLFEPGALASTLAHCLASSLCHKTNRSFTLNNSQPVRVITKPASALERRTRT